jgi:O-antigen/teichoic acid export membrane protein
MTDDPFSSPFAPRRSVAAQAVLLAVSTGIAQLIVAGLYIVSARSASPEQFGYIVAAIALAMSAVGFIDFGTNALWIRDFARGQLTTLDLGARLSTKLVVALLLSLVWALCCVLLFPQSGYWIASPIALTLILNQSSQVPLRAAGRADLVSVSLIVDRITAAVVLLLFIAFGVEAFSVLWVALSVGSLAAAITAWFLASPDSRPRIRLFPFANPWKQSQYYGIAGLAISAQSLDLPIIAGLAGPASAGLYGAVNRWTQPLGLVMGAFSSASVPFVAQSKTWRQAWMYVRGAAWLPFLALAGCLVTFVAAPWAVEILIGPSYKGAGPLLRILALATIPVIINQPLYVFLQSLGHDRPVSAIALISVSVQLIIVAILAPSLGAVAGPIALAVSQVMMLVGLVAAATLIGRERRVS